MNSRDIQIAQAEGNPSILSSLSGAPTQASQLQAPPDAQAAYQQTQQMGADLASKLYGGGPSKALAGNIDQMAQELFKHDQMLEQGQSPYPNLPFYTENPADLYKAGAGYASQASSNIGKTQSAVQTLDQSYINAINSVVGKFMDYFKMAEDKRAREEDRKFEREKFEYEKERDKLERTGGGSPTERLASQAQVLKREIISKVSGGAQLRDLLRDYSDRLSPDEIYMLYQSGGSPYGPPVESAEDLRKIGISADQEGLTPYQSTQMKQEGAKRTAEYMAQIKSYPDRDTAQKEFNLYKPIMQNEGVDVNAIQQAIDQLFPPAQPTSNSFLNIFSSNKPSIKGPFYKKGKRKK